LKKLFGLSLTLGVLSASCTKTEIRYVEVSTTAPDIDETNSAELYNCSRSSFE